MASVELEIDGRRYGSVVALDGLSFDVPSGQVFGFLGPNGAGKTTTMRAIFGAVSLDAGRSAGAASPSTNRRGGTSVTYRKNAASTRA